MIKHFKKGLLMAGILAAVLSLAGCPKEAGGETFSITSIEGTWVCSPYNSTTNIDEIILISSDTIKQTLYDPSDGWTSDQFEGEIVETLQSNSYVGIIGKNSSDKFRLYILKNIKKNTSIEAFPCSDDNTLENAEDFFNEATCGDEWAKIIQDNMKYHTYIRQ